MMLKKALNLGEGMAGSQRRKTKRTYEGYLQRLNLNVKIFGREKPKPNLLNLFNPKKQNLTVNQVELGLSGKKNKVFNLNKTLNLGFKGVKL